ncbi:MAG: hypothetical protein CK429_34235 [Mycobacterium sp.]|jgi:hypothetical protein|uniref:hypothetical protein n=1 Tax=Mycobacterium sp. TaxID=1785 RepID=UPI000CB1457C|nr:hypothetical protein [Mycobacterium sp.]PJE02583.1 MAG: hypothetical protein CK429_34235 [Mycobacterium sp.]PJE10676.1 MAG: hypothetical protein CK428_16000 [Mycobacterium sp.]PJE25326.1 MAG: hypothetical protein CK431_01195 [Mycobacterium sp.]
MDYQLWLQRDDTGTVNLTGWSENTASSHVEHWPTYPLCQHLDQLPTRLTELGLQPDIGYNIADLEKNWDVYLTHPNLTTLRATLEHTAAPR